MRTEPFHVVIIEDDPVQQENVAALLMANGGFEVTGVANNVEQGVTVLTKTEPDLVILDVLLPPKTCFDLLSALGEFAFKIIFTTSHDAYAIRAFRLSAIDYLLKPLDPVEFRAAIHKFRNLMHAEDQTARIQNMLANIQATETDQERVALPTFTGFLCIAVKDIVRCESDDNYTAVYTTDRQKLLISRTLKECEHQLQGFDFFRVHNRHLVSLKHVVEYFKGEGGTVRMVDGSTLEVSRRRKEEFLRAINIL